MKHHKIHKASYKQSLLLLFVITLLIIAPIACSDLGSPDVLSDQQVLNEEMTLTEFKMDINGTEVINTTGEPGASVTAQGIGALALSPKDYGLFKFSIRPFDGAVQAGSISDNVAKFKINELNVSITSSKNILQNNSKSMLWVRHYPTVNPSEAVSAYGDANAPPAPPTPPSPATSLDDVFVVVEEMPKLIGGLASVQSKIEYPRAAAKAGVEGRVTVQFIVDKNGDVVDPRIIKGIGSGCDEEALKAVSQAKFTPGQQRGRNVAVQFSLPIVFKLNNSEF